MSAKTKRLANFELLRIIAMAMVIALHYISRGIDVPKLSVDNSFQNIIWWIFTAFCNVAVNAYVLISGYFLVDAGWDIRKLVKLIVQVLFYSIFVGVLASIILGIPMSFDNILTIFLPIEYEHYWFATAYVVLYMMAPILTAGIKHVSQKQLKTVIIALLCFFCLTKSINPYRIPIDAYGYDFGWFICLFLIAGYIRLYGIKLFDTKTKSILCYLVGVILNVSIALVCSVIVRKTGKMEYYMDMTYAYNYILVLFSSVAFFYIFTYIKIDNYKFSKLICTIAPSTFGIYLLHENVMLRMNWMKILEIVNIKTIFGQILNMICSIVVVFVVGSIIDKLRILLTERY